MNYTTDILNLMSMHFGNYDETSNIGKLLRIMSASDDEFLQASEDTKNVLDLDQAIGKNLDLIHGKNKNLLRGSFTDEEYVQRLKLETKVNNSDGDTETLDQVGLALFGENFRGIIEINDAKIATMLIIDGQSLPNLTYEKAICAAVGNEYNLTDEVQIINVVETTKIQKFIYLESGTITTSNEMGVLL